jgi:hypothetical protein
MTPRRCVSYPRRQYPPPAWLAPPSRPQASPAAPRRSSDRALVGRRRAGDYSSSSCRSACLPAFRIRYASTGSHGRSFDFGGGDFGVLAVWLRWRAQRPPYAALHLSRDLIVGQLVGGIRHLSNSLCDPFVLERRYTPPLDQFAVIGDDTFADISHPFGVSQPISVIEVRTLIIHFAV